MDFLLKSLSPKLLLALLPMILLKVGNWFKGKDADNIGSDDVTGNLLIALAPAMEALDSNNESAFKKSLRIVRDTIDNYLKT